MKAAKLGLAATLCAFVGAAALADAPAFGAADVDGDGALNWTEASAALPDLTDPAFAEADLDGDGLLSRDEYDAAFGG